MKKKLLKSEDYAWAININKLTKHIDIVTINFMFSLCMLVIMLGYSNIIMSLHTYDIVDNNYV